MLKFVDFVPQRKKAASRAAEQRELLWLSIRLGENVTE